MENKLKAGIYKHYKGEEYELVGLATHTETLEKLVVYQALHGNKDIWVRPLEMFLEHVVIENKNISRFEWKREKNNYI